MSSTNIESLSVQIPERNKVIDNEIYKPLFFRYADDHDLENLHLLLNENADIVVSDTMSSQLEELCKCRYPALSFNKETQQQFVTNLLQGRSLDKYGVWVFYPWSKRLVHILDENEFIEVRTNRNKQKITDKERELLQGKKIGIIGLSVGQSIALTLAMERVCGELKLADFDTLELSNCNRIRTGLHNLGVRKSVITAREIAEIDPFIKVACLNEGVHENNIDDFFTGQGKLDLVMEECDSLDIKMLTRIKAKEYRIPLLMDTNDRGMLDIERYDLEPDYLPFHGMLGEINYHFLKGLTTAQKVPYLIKLIGFNTASGRSKVSLIELGQSISNFPQLASSVVLGGAVVTDVGRRILLNQLSVSGRFYADIEDSIKDPVINESDFIPPPQIPLSYEYMWVSALKIADDPAVPFPSKEIIERIVSDAALAPSSGNDQPWKWFYSNGCITLFHDISRSYSFGDYRNMASYISLGAALENFVQSAHHYALNLEINLFPDKNDQKIIAYIKFTRENNPETEKKDSENLYPFIAQRCTNRSITPKKIIPDKLLQDFKTITESFEKVNIDFTTNPQQLKNLGEIISAVDRMRILHPHGHYDFFKREIRWSAEELIAKRTGMDISTLELPPDALLALKIVSDDKIARVLREIDGAQAFKNISVQNTVTASAMGFVTVPDYTPENFVNAGRAVQRLWLKATQFQVAIQPLIGPLYLFPRLVFGQGEGLSEIMLKELHELRNKFLDIFPGDNKRGEVFLLRLFIAGDIQQRSVRLPLEEILFFEKS